MFTLERQEQIYDYLKKNKAASISELSDLFYIGEATIRRDLDKLEKKNLIKRTYGGALLIEGLNTEIPITVREKEQAIAKDIIGRIAADAVSDGDTIIMDSSTTTYAMIPYLKQKKGLTIITNGVKTASSLGTALHTKVYCTGGKLRENSLSLVGLGARKYIQNFFAEKLFFSCRSIDLESGPMDSSEEEAELREAMMNCSDEIYLLCDSSKFYKKAFYHICDYNKIHTIITDTEPSSEFLQTIHKNNVEIRYLR